MSRLSFSHTLLASFLLIAAILGSAALNGLLAFEEFAARSHEDARSGLYATAAVQQLAERTVDMERSARQYLVLENPELLKHFAEAHRESLGALERIEAFGLPHAAALVAGWREAAAEAAGALARPARQDGEVTLPLTRLTPLNEQLATALRVHLGRNSQGLLADLEAHRAILAWHVLAAFVAAGLFAALTGWWMLRPLKAVENAIEHLGESRFDQPVAIAGPADLRRLGRRLDWLRERLADLEANRARLLRHVSHELKTPLAALREGIALLDDHVVGELSGEQHEVVAILENNVRVLQARIESLLGYNAAVFDARSLKRRSVALDTLLGAVLAGQRLQLQARGLRATVSGTAPQIDADPDKLQIVFANLVGNAVSFSPDGGEIRLQLSRVPGWVRVDCIDEGPGVPAEEAARIFEPFFQGSRQPSAPRHGSGLGLSIVREFVLAHGGRVHWMPAARGAHFRVELPHDF
ncbi:HAMP domain-containing histidine kinase [Pseudothauera nasutitermitis]|uniref:Signal transduction histidine-protein kinase/phosphatase MprB n=1 Tax=Pseudothauera nasutitermitis TaxID=2565930 RepID=A0A4V3WCK5_9RHOO|nr:HAMP domain-containing sensor histidine kinase [Pseudothauera nasutitermitis]THF67554.1 HAMP domain-containing histidine kinase [Pseudothauera nasutitermitis]